MMCLEVWYMPGKYLSGESDAASKLLSTSKVNFLLPYLTLSKLYTMHLLATIRFRTRKQPSK